MYKLFGEKYGENVVSLTRYKQILSEYDVDFFHPKKDLCSMCQKTKNVYTEQQTEYLEHL